MKVYDFHLHLCKDLKPYQADQCALMVARYRQDCSEFQKYLDGGNFIINTSILSLDVELATITRPIRDDWPDAMFTAFIDFRDADPIQAVEKGMAHGFRIIKFHPYEQRISAADFPDVLKVALYAARHGLAVAIDTSYGTSKMYAYDNLKLAAYLAEFITDVPLILLHAGGLRVLEAMLLADLHANIMLETAFSVPYYIGSTLEQDFAFAFKKIGAHRVLFGSDFPYMPIEQSITQTVNLLEKYKFTGPEIEKIMYANGRGL